jgi:hypothetical protein
MSIITQHLIIYNTSSSHSIIRAGTCGHPASMEDIRNACKIFMKKAMRRLLEKAVNK